LQRFDGIINIRMQMAQNQQARVEVEGDGIIVTLPGFRVIYRNPFPTDQEFVPSRRFGLYLRRRRADDFMPPPYRGPSPILVS
jgi:hypothetical protein